MAPRRTLPDGKALSALIDAEGRLALHVIPGAKTEEVAIVDGHVMVKVRAKPQAGAANDAVRDLLARALDLAPSRLHLLRGATSRQKLFCVS